MLKETKQKHTRKRPVALLSLPTAPLAVLSSLLLTCVAVPLAGAQSACTVKAPLSAETMEIHLQAKRSIATPAENIEPAVSSAGSSSSFNSEQGLAALCRGAIWRERLKGDQITKPPLEPHYASKNSDEDQTFAAIHSKRSAPP